MLLRYEGARHSDRTRFLCSQPRHQMRVVGRGSSVGIASVSQPPDRGPVPGPGINFTGPREVLLEFVILVF